MLNNASTSLATAQLPHLSNTPMFAPLQIRERVVRVPKTASHSSL